MPPTLYVRDNYVAGRNGATEQVRERFNNNFEFAKPASSGQFGAGESRFTLDPLSGTDGILSYHNARGSVDVISVDVNLSTTITSDRLSLNNFAAASGSISTLSVYELTVFRGAFTSTIEMFASTTTAEFNDITVKDDAYISTLHVKNNSEFAANLSVDGDATVSGSLNVLYGLTVSTSTTINDGASVTGGLSTDTLTASGAISGYSVTISDNASAGSLTVSGESVLTGLTAEATSVTTLASSDAATLNSVSIATTLDVTGATNVTTISSSGAATLASASVTGAATVGTTLAVTGAASFSSTLS
ncbi:MAG: hypothetical protein EBS18_06805, partial [Actinobacteria bacterium]|nr:hypothetical protein [Actinomycetota bacterium]